MQAAELIARAQEVRASAQRQGLDLNAANLVVHATLMRSLNVVLTPAPAVSPAQDEARRGQPN